MRAARATHVDGMVAKNRLVQAAGGAGQGVELRRAPRLNATELNGFNLDDLRTRFAQTKADDRGPLETVLDWFDLPRNTNANIAFGDPTAGGVLGSLGAGAGFGALTGMGGGPAGALAGAAIGAGIVGATQLAAAGVRALTGDELRADIATDNNGVGASEQPKVYMSQVLDRMGIKSDVARGILGFVGDVAIDPLTYLGPAGYTARLAGKIPGIGEKFVSLTKSGNKALNAGVASVAAGRRATDAAIDTYLAAKGFTPEAVRALLEGGKTEAQVQAAIQSVLRGGMTNNAIGKRLTRLGHAAEYEGGDIVRDFHKAPGDAAGDAAKRLIEAHGVGLSERGIRIGVPKGQPGRAWAHIPFTDISLTLPEQARANGIGRQQAFVISSLKNGVLKDAPVVPGAMVAADAGLKIDKTMTEIKAAAEANAEDLARSEDLVKGIRENEPPPPPPPADPLGPPPGSSPDGSPPWPPGSPLTHQPPHGPGMPAPHAGAKPPLFDVDARAQELIDIGEAADPAEARQMAEMEAKAATRAMSEDEFRRALLDDSDTLTAPEVPQAATPKTRTQLLTEMHLAFSDVPERERMAAVALADARAEAMGMSPDEWWPKHIAGFGRGLSSDADAVFHGADRVRRGAVGFLDDGRALVSALQSPNATTLPHEFGHIFRRTLDAAELEAVESHYGGAISGSRPMEERYALDFERYLATGEAPTEALKSVFAKFREWLGRIYSKIVGTPLEQELSPEMRAHFDRILGAPLPAEGAAGVLPGRAGSLRMADGSARPLRYALVDAADVQASHDPMTFSANPRGDINERPYHDPTEGAPSRETVRKIAEAPDLDLYGADTPTATDGPPILGRFARGGREDLAVLGGNARAMGIKRAYARGNESLREQMLVVAKKYGIDTAGAADMRQPMVVRIMDEPGKPGEMSRVLNESLTTGRTADADAISRGSKVDSGTVSAISQQLGDGTLREALGEPKQAAEIIKALVGSGALSDKDLLQYLDHRGLPNAAGKDLIERVMLGSVIRDVRTLAEMPGSLRNTLTRALPALMRLRRVPGLDFDKTLADLVDAATTMRQTQARSMSHLLEQVSMTPEPWRQNRGAMGMLHALIEDTPTAFAKRLFAAAEAAEDAASGQGSLMGPVHANAAEAVAEHFPTPTGADGTPLFQSDVAGQNGLFGQGVVATGEKQGGLFGDVSKPAETPKADPMARREGETIEEWRIRVKFKEAEKNTGTLFQDALILEPDEPLSREMLRREAFVAQYREEQAARMKSIRDQAERVKAAVLATDAKEYAQTPETAAAALRLAESYHQAVAGVDHAEATLNLYEKVQRVLPSMEHLDPEDFARKLPDALWEAAGMSEARDGLLGAAKADPRVIDDLAEAARMSVESAKEYADLVRGSIDTLRTSPDVALAAYAASLLGMDESALALTFFGRMGKMLAGPRTPETVVQSLTAMDRWADRTFHTGKGYMQRELARTKADVRGTAMVAARMQKRIGDKLKSIAAAHGVDDAIDEMGPLAYSMMYRAVDPAERIYHWRRFDPRGPGFGEPTALAAMLERAQKTGLLSNPKLRAELERSVAEWVGEVRSMGDAELTDDLLNELMSGYLPLTPSDDTRLKMFRQRAAFPESGSRPGTSASQPFQIKRTTANTRFPVHDPSLMEQGNWREFYDFDRWVMDRPGLFAGGRDIKAIAAELHVSEKMAQTYQDAFDAMTAYDKAVAADPSFLHKYPARPTDHMTLNELWAEGRFRRLVGNSPEPEALMDGGAPFVLGVRAGAHERSVGMAKIADLVRKHARMASPELIAPNLNNKGMTGRLHNGVEFRILDPVQREGGEAFAAEIGGERFRLLDPGTRGSWLGKLLPNDVLVGGLLPDKLADRIEDVARAAQTGRGDMETLLNTADHLVGVWKKLTLLRPAWTVVDFIGNLWLASSGGARPTDLMRHAPDMFRLRRLMTNPDEAAKLSFTLQDGRRVGGEEMLNTLLHHGLFERNLSAEVHGKLAAADSSILWKPDVKGRAGKIFEWNHRLNAMSNDWVRGLAFMSFLEQGNDAATAARKTLDAMFDWADFSRVEEKVFRRLIPFYSWMRNNWSYQLHLVTQKPIWAAATPRLSHAIEEMVAGNAAVPMEDRPQWMREEMVTQLTGNPDNRVGLAIGNLLPASDLYDLLQAGTGTRGLMAVAKKLTTSVNPLPMAIAQLGTGTEFFTGRKIAPDAAGGDLSAGQFLANQVGPLALGTKTAEAYSRSVTEGVGRTLLSGRVQGMDDQRLYSTKDREDRDAEMKLRGAIVRARRHGDSEAALEATARLLRLYQRRQERGQDIPNWAEGHLAKMA